MIRTASQSSAAASVSSLSAYMRSVRLSSSSKTTLAPASRRLLSTSQPRCEEAQAYPFSSQVTTQTPPPVAKKSNAENPSGRFSGFQPLPKVTKPSRGVIDYVHHQLRSEWDPQGRFTAMFHRNSDARVPIGSILAVDTWSNGAKTSSSTFSGVLIGIRRRGTSTSFVLRNMISKLGVEVRFNIYSPLLKDIKVIAKADSPKRPRRGILVRSKKAKLYYIRKDDARLANIARIIKTDKANEQKAEAIRAEELKKEKAQAAQEARRAAKEAAGKN